MKLINRKTEMEFLKKKYLSNKAELLIIYGRRRIGKTEFLNYFLQNKPNSIYFLARMESKRDTVKRFNNSLISAFSDFGLVNRPLNNWDDFFSYLAEKSKNKRFILVIDEFPFLVEKFPEIVSVLQDKWDNLLKETKIMLVLCGSSVSMMEKCAIDYKSPLYGRRTGQWLMEKMQVCYLTEFLPKYGPEELMVAYSCLDTIPGYMVKFDSKEDVWANIKKNLLSKGEFLYEEAEILLREELRDPSNYMSILSSIAGGIVTFNEIYNKTGMDKSLLSKYLYILERLGVVEKSLPITESYKNKLKAKGALYFIKDNFFDFWFRFVYLNKQGIEREESEKVLISVRSDINQYLGKKFERFITELLPLLKIFDYTKIGRWWRKDSEIDIVALNETTKDILFAECKWQDKVNAEKVLAELKEKAKLVEWHNEKRKEHFAVFAKSFSKRIKEKKVLLFDLKGIEKILKI